MVCHTSHQPLSHLPCLISAGIDDSCYFDSLTLFPYDEINIIVLYQCPSHTSIMPRLLRNRQYAVWILPERIDRILYVIYQFQSCIRSRELPCDIQRFEKNKGIDIYSLAQRSSEPLLWWKCPKCHAIFTASVGDMTSGKADCPYCADRRVLPGLNSFKAKHSDLMDEWIDLTNSFLADPDRISDSSQVVVWWKCPREHHYRMSPARRLMFQKRHKEPCPYCKGLRLKLRHFF